MKYAEVVVNVPTYLHRSSRATHDAEEREDVRVRLVRTYHYAVPREWLGKLQPGHLVQVPFGKQEVQGIVTALSDESPVAETRYITAVVDETPVVTPAQIELAHWISHYYLAPLFSALQQMLPPGIEQRSRLVVRWVWKGELLPDLPANAQKLGALLREKGELRSDQLSRRMPEADWRKAIDLLEARGMVTAAPRLTPPRIRVKVEQMVRAITSHPRRELLDSSLGRKSKQADLVRRLLESDDPLPSLDSLCQAAGCTAATAKSLEKRGMIQITPAQTLVRLTLGESQAHDASEAIRSKQQRQVMEWLRARPEEMVDIAILRKATNAAPKDVSALGECGLIAVVEEPATALLTCEREEAENQLLTMRGLEKRLSVLEFLVAEGKPTWVGAVYAETGANAAMLRELAEAGLVALMEQERIRDPLSDFDFVPDHAPRLTPDQERVWREIEAAFVNGEAAGQAYLLHGVTGSGKTEIYMHALDRALEAGRQAIVLVPEISLTPQTIRRFSARFPGRVTTIHSKLSLGERYDQWRKIRTGQVDIVIGPRSAVFAPLPHLGVIVVDEEHEDAYKSEWMPVYHAREVALQRARIERCPIIMGSATPSLESYYNAQRDDYRLLVLPKRVMGHARQIEAQSRRFQIAPERQVAQPVGHGYEEARFIELPEVEVVDLRAELRAGNRSIYSRALQRELKRVLDNGEQAILFLNRRGTATVVSCRDCGHVVKCPRCSTPMTYHGSNVSLVCHHCNQRLPAPAKCPECGSRRIRYLGTGTERVEETLQELFPAARTLRWDRDVTGAKGAHQAILDQFIAGEADVLIGTQMIAKGLDLPLVTLVGVVLADTGLFLPDFRAAERAFLLLTQVAGRAGRSILGGRVVIQTYNPQHYAIQFASRHDFTGFYREELRRRHELGYPPFCRLALLGYAHKNSHKAQDQAKRVARQLEAYLAACAPDTAALAGPAPCFFSRVRGKYRWQIILRATDPADILAGFPLPAGWRLDIDPTSLL